MDNNSRLCHSHLSHTALSHTALLKHRRAKVPRRYDFLVLSGVTH